MQDEKLLRTADRSTIVALQEQLTRAQAAAQHVVDQQVQSPLSPQAMHPLMPFQQVCAHPSPGIS